MSIGAPTSLFVASFILKRNHFMKSILIAALLAGPALTLAEAKPAPSNKTASPTAKASKPAAAKSKDARNASRGKAPVKKTVAANRTELRSTAAQVAAGQRAADRALTPAELALADSVQTGRIPCELGNIVILEPDPKAPGHFDLELQKTRFRMTPVETTTGAVRLEDAEAGAVWLQLGNKSMLMNTKLGQRLADDCQSPQQTTVAEAMKRTPPPSLLDGTPAGSIETAAPVPAPASAEKAGARATSQRIKIQ